MEYLLKTISGLLNPNLQVFLSCLVAYEARQKRETAKLKRDMF